MLAELAVRGTNWSVEYLSFIVCATSCSVTLVVLLGMLY